jgi:hypothetical protein
VQRAAPQGPAELAVVAEALAESGEDRALAFIEGLRQWQPAEADAVLGAAPESRPLSRRRHALEAAFVRHRHDPWPRVEIMRRALQTAKALTERQPGPGPRMYAALQQPFAARSIHEPRALLARELASQVRLRPPTAAMRSSSSSSGCRGSGASWRSRTACYAAMGDARVVRAKSDLAALIANEPPQMGAGLRQAQKAAPVQANP